MSRDYLQQRGRGGKAAEKGPDAAPGKGKPAKDVPVGIVCGLGNPGKEYENTRHNVGFLAIDRLAQAWGASYWKTKPGALVAEVSVAGRTVVLVKPTSYMNVSGGPLKKIAEEYKVPAGGILAIHDDLELPAGAVAVKLGGGHAGHNGLRSIAEKFGTSDYPRVRCGIGRPPGRMAPADFVLKELKGRDLDDFLFMADEAAIVARYAVENGIPAAAARYPAKR